jgi:hypothetical protein
MLESHLFKTLATGCVTQLLLSLQQPPHLNSGVHGGGGGGIVKGVGHIGDQFRRGESSEVGRVASSRFSDEFQDDVPVEDLSADG